MFKKRTSKNKTSKRTPTTTDNHDDDATKSKSTLLSFDAGDEGPVFKVKKKKLRKAPRPRAPSEETKDPAPATSLYSAEGLAALRASQKALPAELAAEADMIIGMTHGHVEMVNLMFPHVVDKTFLLREFDDSVPLYEREVSDPIGGSYQVYCQCRDQIREGIDSLLNSIQQNKRLIPKKKQ